MMSALFAILLGVYVVATAARMIASLLWLKREAPAPGTAAQVTILQPILSGDPHLEDCLRANQDANPDAKFLMLVDEDDEVARDIAERPASGRVSVLVGPPPADGENPKSAKLARALPKVETPLFGVLDDDTMLPRHGAALAAGALNDGDLVTGLPLYVTEGGFFSRLLAAFVNGAALITYPCAAFFGQQRTINGMFYLGRVEDLRALGGFSAIVGSLTDDYAMAKLYLDGGKRIVQSAIVHPIRTTVTGGAHYASIMRRWMIFGLRYVRENRSPFTLGLIGAPTLLPPLLMVVGVLAGFGAVFVALVALAEKAFLMSLMRKRFAADVPSFKAIGFEILADLATPFHLGAALVRPRSFRWRSRKVRMRGDTIGYD
jgi:ceramide glucosyltransferase